MNGFKQLNAVLDKQLIKFVDDVNGLISDFNAATKPVELGPQYAHFTDFDAAQENLVFYRMKKKWGAPDFAAQQKVRIKSVLDVFAADEEGPTTLRSLYDPDIDPFVRKILYESRVHLSKLLRKHYRFNPANLRMPSGESVRNAQGDVSVLAKLRDKKEWCVTAECVDLFATVCYKVPALKAAARRHIGKLDKQDAKRLYHCFGSNRDCGYLVFRELLLSEVLTIVPGSRVETVPKELDKLRVISCEPFCNMIVQSVIEEGIRDAIRAEFGIDLNTSQDIHKELIKIAENATIDLKNASNSNFLIWIQFLYPEYLVKQLIASRSPCGIFNENPAEKQAPRVHHWNMVSPMGNGFTFGLMTLTLLTIARQLDSFAHVFGDDIIIHQDCAQTLIDTLDVIGFKTNDTKTFVTGGFRESCGAFTFNGRNLYSYNFEWAECAQDAITLVNKVQLLAESTGIASLRSLALALVAATPALCKRATPCLSLEPRWVCLTTRSAQRKKRNDKDVKRLWELLKGTHDVRKFCATNQINEHDLDVYVSVTMEAEKYRCRLPTHNANAFWVGHFLYAGRCSAPVYKPTGRRPLKQRLKFLCSEFVVNRQLAYANELVPYQPMVGPPKWLFMQMSRNFIGPQMVA